MPNPFVHVELMSNDVERSKRFYQGLFDWQLEEIPGIDYTLIKVGEGTGGGITKLPLSDQDSRWMAYVLVADVAASTEIAEALGATVLKAVTEVPNIGLYSVIADPTGAIFAMWQPKGKTM